MQSMDESKLKAIRSRNSVYISLQDQEQAEAGLEHNLRPQRLKLSKDHTTYVHLAVQQEQHWAAVQISLSPFSLQHIPEQKFYSCHFCYTWCCEAPATTGPPNDVLGSVVQRIYDVYFQPTQWDFSSKHCRTRDFPSRERSPNEATCVKKAESSLSAYIQHANGSAEKENHLAPSGESVVDNATDRPTDQIKRRRLHHSDDIESDSNINDNNNDDVASEIRSVARPGAGNEDAESKKEKMIADLTTRIQTALKKKFPTEKKTESKKMRKKLLKQAKCADATVLDPNARGQHPTQTDHPVISEFNIRHAGGEFNIVDPFVYWEAQFWGKASKATKDAHEISWKFRFVAACIRRMRDRVPAVCSDTSAVCNDSDTTRFTSPKDDRLSVFATAPMSTLPDIIDGAVANLRMDSAPPAPVDMVVFHPAVWISSIMNIEYKKVCSDLGLTSSSALLDPPHSLQSQASLSWLSDRWRLPTKHWLIESSPDSPGSPKASSVRSTTCSPLAMSQLHEPGAASMPSVLVGGSEEDANPEQLTRKDLRPQC
ncbi:hypothetical protein BDZ45DRAFT_697076 [Acephala macrosclerotiorum]|nr:hypothetical protein BDZ45DRAFT_697076 [Acephala macrosclerotiorum]